jgi:hypothetical protein
MDLRVARYIRHGKFYVEGWLRTEAALTIAALNARQRALDAQGGIAEIGVHHGKLFILLYLLGRAPEKAVAIDLFEDQHLNVDLSGSGDLAKFRRNLARHTDGARLVLRQGNSMDLTGADLVRLAEGPLRFISVDGGHTAEITAHDLAVADASLAEGGIIVLDDAFNEQWPGVADGVQRHFARCPYRAAAMAVASDTTMPEFLGEPVAFLQFTRLRLRDRLKDRLAGSPAWRRLRTTRVGLPLRWAWHTGRTLRRGLTRREDF